MGRYHESAQFAPTSHTSQLQGQVGICWRGMGGLGEEGGGGGFMSL